MKKDKQDLKVIIVANTLWNIHNFRQPIIEMLEKKGAAIYIAAPFHFSKIDLAPNLNFIGLKYAKSHQNGLLNACKSIQEFSRIFKDIQPDLVLLYTMKPNIFGNIAAAQLGIPVISTVTGLGYTFIRGGLIRYLSERLYQYAFRKTKYVIFHNPDDLQLFVNQGFVSEKRCKVIRGSGVNTEKYKPEEKTLTDKFVFLFIGRLLIDKGIKEYLAAAKQMAGLKDVEFHIIGDLYPENPAALSEKEWSLEFERLSNVIWHKKQDDVRPFIAAADVMVLPSYREGLPMAVLEAMAMAKPIITTDVPGCRETVEENVNGFLVKPKNAEHLFSAMLEMYKMPKKRRQKLGKRSREKAVEEFSQEIVVQAYEQLIEKAYRK